MFIAMLAARNKNSQGAKSGNPKTQLTSLWCRLFVLLMSIRSYPLRLCHVPSLLRSLRAASFFEFSSDNRSLCSQTRRKDFSSSSYFWWCSCCCWKATLEVLRISSFILWTTGSLHSSTCPITVPSFPAMTPL